MLAHNKSYPSSYYPSLNIVKQAVERTNISTSMASFLLSRINRKSFFDDFFYYNANIDQYIASFGEQYIGLLKNDEMVLRSIIESYTKSIYHKSNTLNLFEKLFDAFVKTCCWKQTKCFSNGNSKDSGIYVLYNTATSVSYIGESYSIEKRFISHKLALANSKHVNKGLLNSVLEHGMDSLFFLVLDFGPSYADLKTRRGLEIEQINSWPGPIYNIKDVPNSAFFRKKTRRKENKNCFCAYNFG